MTGNETQMDRNRVAESSYQNNSTEIPGTPSRRRLLHLLGAGGVMGLAGCFSEGGGSADGMATPTSTGEQDEKQSATIALPNAPTTGSNIDLWGGLTNGNSIPIHENLVRITSDFSEWAPELATEWEPTGDTTWEFTLREGVTFHNGASLTAEAVAESFRGAFEIDPVGFTALTKDSFTAVDELTLELETTNPSPVLPGNLAHPAMQVQYRGDDAGNGPIGTGPFKAEDTSSRVPQDEPITTVEFDDYWGDSPHLSTLVFNGITDNNTRTLSLQAGDVDAAHELPKQRFKDFQNSDKVTVGTKEEPRTVLMAMNIYKPPTDDRKLRLALHWATDQETLVEAFLQDVGTPAIGPYANVIEWSVNDELPKYGPDMDRAQELVEESNYDGKEMDLIVQAGKTIDQQIAERLQQNANKIGVNINVRVIEPASHFSKFMNGKVNLYFGNWGSWSGATDYLLFATLHSKGFINQPMIEKNGTGVVNLGEDMDQLIEKGYYEWDKEKRHDTYRKIQQRVMDAGMILPINYRANILGTRSYMSGPKNQHTVPLHQEWSTFSYE